MSEVTFNPGKRRLCPDDACIGVIGDDGRCPVCGTAVGGAAVSAPSDANPATSFGDPYAGDDAADPDVDAAGDDAGAAPGTGMETGPGARAQGFRPGRKLCDDGSCIGVIGDDGACSVCGRRAGF